MQSTATLGLGLDPAPHDVEAFVRKALGDAGAALTTCHGTFVAVTPVHPAYHGW